MSFRNLEFKIPSKRDDLRESKSINQYAVSEVYPIDELKTKIKECKIRAGEFGYEFVLEHFPTMYSILHHLDELGFEILKSFYEDIVVKQLKLLVAILSDFTTNETSRAESRMEMLNITKMMLYISIEFFKSFQDKIEKECGMNLDMKLKRNTKMTKQQEDLCNWVRNEQELLIVVKEIVKLPLKLLWDPPTPEEAFVSMIADFCYFVLQKRIITSNMKKQTQDIINELFVILIKQYNNAIGCKVNIVQLLKNNDNLEAILAKAVVFIVKEGNCRSLVNTLIDEINNTETVNQTNNSAQESNSSSRSLSNFIIKIAELQPEVMLPCVDLLVCNLNQDPYSLRICTLTVMKEIIVCLLCPTTGALSDENKALRDSLLNHLLEHAIDMNSYVRSKVMGLWCTMWEKKVVPKNYIIPLLKQATGRLQDRNSYVVKNSIKLITSLLTANLFGPSLDTEAVERSLRAVKLQLIQEENKKNQPSVLKIWSYSKSDISDYIAKQITDDETDVDPECDSVNEENSNEENPPSSSENSSSDELSQLRNFVLKQDYKNIYFLLSKYESKNIKKLKFLQSVGDKVRYYEWILGNLCHPEIDPKKDILERFALCADSNGIEKLLEEPVQSDEEEDEEDNRLKEGLTYYEHCLRFVKLMNVAVEMIGELMMNQTTTEVVSEAIDFFIIAHKSGLERADDGVRKMLLLINSKEVNVKEAVKNAFYMLFFESDNENKKEAAIEAVNKLIPFLKKVTHEQKIALEVLIKQWVVDDTIKTEFVNVLWGKYSRKLSNASIEDCTAAAVLISMYANGKPETVKCNIDLIIKHGLDMEKNYFSFMKHSLIMFRSLFGLKKDNGQLTKYPRDFELFEKLTFVIQEQFTNLDNEYYPEISMEAITIIYRLSEFPDTICGDILHRLYEKLSTSVTDEGEVFCNEETLARFLIIIGHVAFCEWQYLENDVLNEEKRRHNCERRQQEKNDKTKSSSSKDSASQKRNDDNSTSDQFEDDTQASVNEKISEWVRNVCEGELLKGNNLLKKLSSLVLHVCKNPIKYNSAKLKSAVSLSLSKLMMISQPFCQEQIQHLVTMLENSKEPDVKINIVLAFGDLMFRFPNIMEEYTSNFYNRLKDESADVRYSTLIIISHLITNEMVKVRSQMSDVALCLVDSDELVRSLATKLFYDISQKGNTLYNVMADIISRLSHPDHRPDEKTFQIILKVLMKLITKDRHIDSIVEKLCHRLRGAEDERQCVDLSYCLTLITYSERSIQKLVDNIACYADKLSYAKVHKNFSVVIMNCKKLKTNKLDDKTISELEEKIDIILNKGIDNLEMDFLRAPKTPARANMSTRTPRKVDNTVCETPHVASTRKPRSRTVRKPVLDSDDDE